MQIFIILLMSILIIIHYFSNFNSNISINTVSINNSCYIDNNSDYYYLKKYCYSYN